LKSEKNIKYVFSNTGLYGSRSNISLNSWDFVCTIPLYYQFWPTTWAHGDSLMQCHNLLTLSTVNNCATFSASGGHSTSVIR